MIARTVLDLFVGSRSGGMLIDLLSFKVVVDTQGQKTASLDSESQQMQSIVAQLKVLKPDERAHSPLLKQLTETVASNPYFLKAKKDYDDSLKNIKLHNEVAPVIGKYEQRYIAKIQEFVNKNRAAILEYRNNYAFNSTSTEVSKKITYDYIRKVLNSSPQAIFGSDYTWMKQYEDAGATIESIGLLPDGFSQQDKEFTKALEKETLLTKGVNSQIVEDRNMYTARAFVARMNPTLPQRINVTAQRPLY